MCALESRRGTDPEKNRFDQGLERVDALGSIFLGLSLECARCHDHPYEPITQAEYYGLVAAFDNCENHVQFAAVNGDQTDEILRYEQRIDSLVEQRKLAPLLEEWEDQLRFTSQNYGIDNGWDNQWLRLQIYIDQARQILFAEPASRSLQERVQLLEFFLREAHDAYPSEIHDSWGLPAALEKLKAIQEEYPLEQAMVIRENESTKETALRVRGDFYQLGDAVLAGVPMSLSRTDRGGRVESTSRLGIADWLVSDCEQLLSRVIVNRVWRELFGQALVEEDFGVRSKPPRHLKLLDTLAAQFVSSGWDFKFLIKNIATTSVYQLDSSLNSAMESGTQIEQAEFLIRQKRVRLTGEQVRDRILAVSGLLNSEGGYRSFFPPQPGGTEQLSINPNPYWKTSVGEERYRRSLYIHKQRTSPFPFLDLFGSPDGNAPCTSRRMSASPLQSLATLNDQFVLTASRNLAKELLQSSDEDERLRSLWLKLFANAPNEKQEIASKRFLDTQLARLESSPTEVFALAQSQDQPELAAWTALVRAMFNTDAFLRRE